MSLPQKHFNNTYELIKKVGKKKVAKWLLEEGYYPEQYVLPPCFHIKSFKLKKHPYFKVKSKKDGGKEFKPSISEFITVSFPKSQLTDRTFGIIYPRLYHDIVFYIMSEWDFVLSHIFNDNNKVYSYSFPIPLTKKSEGELGSLRAGRMIYEYIEMAENDLVAEAHKFKYIVKTDIKNFYPSIYTHSLAWALHGKKAARNDIGEFKLLGSKLDKLFQNSNDRCTNGIPIGSAISDLISEMLLSSIDREFSNILIKSKIKFLSVRFKDDYIFLCNSKNDADFIIKTLQSQMRLYNLSLTEGKTEFKELPEGLFRPWISEYQKYSLKFKSSISYKRFETTLLAVLKIDERFPDTGVVDKFLSELVSKKYNLKLSLKTKDALKVFSLLFLLKERRSKAFPQILAIIELLLERFKNEKELIENIRNSLIEKFKNIIKNDSDYQYDILWIFYLLKSSGISKLKISSKTKCPLLLSVKSNSQKFFNTEKEIILYKKIKSAGKNKKLVKHLAVFPREEKL